MSNTKFIRALNLSNSPLSFPQLGGVYDNYSPLFDTEVKRLCREFGFIAGIPKGSLAKDRKTKEKQHLSYHLKFT